MKVTTCPECDGKTKLADTRNIWNSEVRHIRVCKDCAVEYTVSYGRPVIDRVEEVQ